jgi:MFS family permease
MVNYGLIVMTLTHTLTHVFGNLYTSSFPILRGEFNLTIYQLGLFAAIPPLCQALFSIPAGILTDKVGSRRMLLVSLILAVGGSLLAASTFNAFMLIVAASLVYMNTTIYHPASYSFTTRLFRRSDRPKALGIHGAGGTFGVALGPLTLSLFLALNLTWRHVYLFWAFPIALGALLVLRVREPEAENGNSAENALEIEPGEATTLFTRSLLMFLVYTGIRTIAGQMISTFMPLYIVDERGFSMEQMGLLVGSLSLTGLLAAPIGGYMAARFRNPGDGPSLRPNSQSDAQRPERFRVCVTVPTGKHHGRHISLDRCEADRPLRDDQVVSYIDRYINRCPRCLGARC